MDAFFWAYLYIQKACIYTIKIMKRDEKQKMLEIFAAQKSIFKNDGEASKRFLYKAGILTKNGLLKKEYK